MKKLMLILAMVALFGFGGVAQATILPFNQSLSGTQINTLNYGDNVAGSPQGGFTYTNGGEGFTPNVTVTFTHSGGGNNWVQYSSVGDLSGIIYPDLNGFGTASIEFTAAPGYKVRLYDMSAAAFVGGQSFTYIRVRDSANTLLAERTSFAVPTSGHISFTNLNNGTTWINPVNGFEDDILKLQWQPNDNLWNMGFDNIRFGQVAEVSSIPEPSTFVLGALGLVSLGCIALRRKCRRA